MISSSSSETVFCFAVISFQPFLFFVVYFILSRLLYLAYSAYLGLLCMPYPGMGPLV